jgi:hypothetical protein
MDNSKVTIRIALDSVWSKLVILTLVVVGLTGSVALALDDSGQTPEGNYAPLLQTAGGRGFYVTPDKIYQGDEALTACDPGYHMASLWEIFDVSNLTYDTVRGFDGADSGEGPPTGVTGWVRTGYHASEGDEIPGIGNCAVWTTNITSAHGTVVMMGFDWTREGSAINPWQPMTTTMFIRCDQLNRVWCVED